MAIYNVEIVETLSKVVEQEADNYEDAQDLVEEKYNNDEIELDYNDLEETNYKRYPYPRLKESFDLSIDFDKECNDMYISLEGSSGARYDCKTIEDLKKNINEYLDNYIELEKSNDEDNDLIKLELTDKKTEEEMER